MITLTDYAYENMRRVAYGDCQFVPVCPNCGRFVKADKDMMVNALDEVIQEPNATCTKCGRVSMPCEGYL